MIRYPSCCMYFETWNAARLGLSERPITAMVLVFSSMVRMVSGWFNVLAMEIGCLVHVGRFFDCGRHATLPAHDQVSTDEWIEIAIKDGVHIAHLDPGAQVFGDAIGLQHIRPDL